MLKYLQDILHNPSILCRLTWQLLLHKSINEKLAEDLQLLTKWTVIP